MSYSPLQTSLDKFLHIYLEPDRPVLLAYSGGADSTCLLHLLLTYKERNNLDLHLAHIDHGWRPESTQEAEKLQQNAEKLGLPFHHIRLYPEYMKGNLEAACREERLKFFYDLSVQYGFQGVITAHHSDDLAENVLQHIFEGAPLAYMGGMLPVSILNHVVMFRPLLDTPKEAILQYLSKHNIDYIHDVTNNDSRFMRGRFRTTIIPQLAKEFGKEIKSTLSHIALESFELRFYLERRIERFKKVSFKSPLGLYIDLSEEEELSPVEVKFLIRRIAELSNSFFPHPIVDEVAHLVVDNAANKQVVVGHGHIRVDRGRLFFPVIDLVQVPKEPLELRVGNFTYGDWEVEVTKHPVSKEATSWQHMWQGYTEVILPKGDYYLAPVSPKDKLHTNKTIGDWWTDKSIPSFLRYFVPAVWQGDKIVHEFLTGKYTIKSTEKEGLKIKLYYKPSICYKSN